jgi:steroid delta-isomerase-like uncharacterized protein
MVMAAITKLSQDYMKAFNAHDIEKIQSYYTDDCMVENLGTGQVMHGVQDVKNYFLNFFSAFPDVQTEFTNDFRCNDWSATEWIMTGTHKGTLKGSGGMPDMPATNKKISVKGAMINHIHQDKIQKEIDYFNFMSVMQQLGMMPEMKK